MKTQTQTTWSEALATEKQKPYFQNIMATLKQRQTEGAVIYPPAADIFNALKLTGFEDTKVVIIGQDPYHGPNQAHGLCFSVKDGVRPPPSLQNIFKELHDDLGLSIPSSGNLEAWAKQGVLLLNTSLTVEKGNAGSHSKIGWQEFTDSIIKSLNKSSQGIVYLLWGAHAQRKRELIDESKHVVLTAAHPSPFSAHRGFLGCKHFSQTNQLLESMGRKPVDWQL